jgi:hypothetical protein
VNGFGALTVSPLRKGIAFGVELRNTGLNRSLSLDLEPDATRTKRWVLACSAVAVLGASWIAQVPLDGMPHVSDEIAYALQAKLFAAGARVGPEADVASMWVLPFWNVDGAMYSPFPPGWPALLSLAERLGVASWLNPLLVGLLPWILYRLGAAAANPKVGQLAALIGALSPGVLLLGGSWMAHTSVLVALGILMVVVMEGVKGRLAGTWGALAAAYVVVARPFDAFLLAGPLLLWGLGDARKRSVLWVWAGLPGCALAVVLLDNHNLTGDVFRFPMSDWFDAWQGRLSCNELGFGASVGCAPTLGSYGHTPAKALALGLEALRRFDGLLLGFPGGTILALVGAWILRARRGWVWVVLVVVGYGAYWSPGRAYGARFWHPMYLVVPVAVAGALQRFPLRWSVLGLVVASVFGVSRIAPDLAGGYWCVGGGLAAELKRAHVEEGVVFLRTRGTHDAAWPSMGVNQFQCDPMLKAGEGWALADPSSMSGGLQIRHALPDMEQTKHFMETYHPGVAAWVLEQDLSSGRRELRSLGLLSDP